MRKIKTGFLLALPVLAFVIISAFSAREGNPSVHGGGTAMELGEKSTFAFNAVQEDDGSVNGHLVYHVRGGDVSFELDIDCMTINGNRATLGGKVTSVSGNAPGFLVLGARAAFTVEDNGQGRNAAPDRFSDVLFPGTCAANYVTYIPISGNIQINE
jgi:hypothetical protein